MKRLIILSVLVIFLRCLLLSIFIDEITSYQVNTSIDYTYYQGSINRYENRLFVHSQFRLDEYLIENNGSPLDLIGSHNVGLYATSSLIDEDRFYSFYVINRINYMAVYDLLTIPMTLIYNIELPIPVPIHIYPPKIIGDTIFLSEGSFRTLRLNKYNFTFQSPIEGEAGLVVKDHYILKYKSLFEQGVYIDSIVQFYDYTLSDEQNPLGVSVHDLYLTLDATQYITYLKIEENFLYVLGTNFVALYDVSELENGFLVTSIDFHESGFDNVSYSDALLNENTLLCFYEKGFHVYNVSDIDNILLIYQKEWQSSSQYYNQIYAYNNTVYINEYYCLGVYNFFADFPQISRYGNFSNDYRYSDGYVLKNSRFLPEFLLYNILDQSIDPIVFTLDYDVGEYFIADFMVIENRLYALSWINDVECMFQIYDIPTRVIVFDYHLPFNSAYMKIIDNFIFFHINRFSIGLPPLQQVYQLTENYFEHLGSIDGFISNTEEYDPDNYFSLLTNNSLDFREKANPFNIIYSLPLFFPNMGDLEHLTNNLIYFHTNGLNHFFYTFEDGFSDFSLANYLFTPSITYFNFFNGFMSQNGITSSISRLFQLENYTPRQIWELEEHSNLHGVFLYPEDNKMIVRKWSGIYLYDIVYTEYVSEIDNPIPLAKTELLGNYPNPFNPSTTIKYSAQHAQNLRIDIYNIKGQKVKSLLNEYKPAGEFSIVWDGKDDKGNDMGSGIYFYKMEAGDFISTKKMVLIK